MTVILRCHAGYGILVGALASRAALAVATVITAVAITEVAAIAVAKAEAPLVALASRSTLRIIAEGPSSCSRTRTVR